MHKDGNGKIVYDTPEEEIAALNRKVTVRDNKLDNYRLRMKQLRKIFTSNDLGQIRGILLSFADEFVMAQEAAENRATERRVAKDNIRARKRLKKELAGEEIPKRLLTRAEIEEQAYRDKLNDTRPIAEVSAAALLRSRTYTFEDGTSKTVEIPEELAQTMYDLMRFEANGERAHERKRHITPAFDIHGESNKDDEDLSDIDKADTVSGGSSVWNSLVKREQAKINALTREYMIKWHEEIKAKLAEFLPPKQAQYYYEYQYNGGKPKAELARRMDVTFNAVKDTLTKAIQSAFIHQLTDIQPSAEIAKRYIEEKAKLRNYT
jgi:hypothetical protein